MSTRRRPCAMFARAQAHLAAAPLKLLAHERELHLLGRRLPGSYQLLDLPQIHAHGMLLL